MPTRPGYIWSGTEWVSIGQEAVAAPVSYQTSAPSTPSTGDIWIDSNDDVPGIDTSQFLRWRKTAVGGETSVSGTDDNGLTLQYTANYEQVYLNGVLLVRGQDYTATNGTSITGLTALAANDVVEVFGVVARVVGDVYTQAQTNSLLDAKSNVSSTGLVLITSVNIPASTTTLTVNNAFNANYDAYKVIITNGSASTASDIKLTLGSSASNYNRNVYGFVSAFSGGKSSGDSFLYSGTYSTDFIDFSFDIINPFLAKWTIFKGVVIYSDASAYTVHGTHTLATSYSSFTIAPAAGTLSGGTIKVYGYK